jgi:hypothetical protein
MMEFSAGDLVQLKSGGPKMTVKKVGRDGMTVSTSDNGSHLIHNFHLQQETIH